MACAGRRLSRYREPRQPAGTGTCGLANAADIDAAAQAAHKGFLEWTKVPAAQKSAMLREIARRLRLHVEELAVGRFWHTVESSDTVMQLRAHNPVGREFGF